jgi:hypothetical protein
MGSWGLEGHPKARWEAWGWGHHGATGAGGQPQGKWASGSWGEEGQAKSRVSPATHPLSRDPAGH